MHPLNVDPVGLDGFRPPIHQQTRGIEDMIGHAMRFEQVMQSEPVVARLVARDHLDLRILSPRAWVPVDDVSQHGPTRSVARATALRWWMVSPDDLRDRSGFQWRAAVEADSAAFAAVPTSSSGSLCPVGISGIAPSPAISARTIRDPPL